MAINADDVFKKLPIKEQRQINKRADELMAEYPAWQEFYRAQKMAKVKIARKLGITQKQFLEIEKETDLHISMLRRTIEAMGGSLTITAQFLGRPPLTIRNFSADND